MTVNNGIVYVGTLYDNGLVFGLDYANPAVPRIVSSYAHGDFILTWVGSVLFNGTDMFVGGSLRFSYPVAQVDMAQPFDSINQYFPPAALQVAAPLNAARRSLPNVKLGHPGSARFPKLQR